MSAPWVKFFFGLSLHIFLWKMRATPGTCTKQGCLARRPFCHKVNLPASCRRRSNSIPWWTSFHVMLSLRTWHIMISNLQHPKGFTCVSLSVENYRLCARSQLISFARFTRRTQARGEPKLWLIYKVVPTKHPLRCEANYQRIIYYSIALKGAEVYNGSYKQNLTYRCDKQFSEAQSTRYWLKQSSRKFPGQNTDLLFWINKVCDIFFSISEQTCLALCRLDAAWHLCLGSYHTETHGNIYRSLF